MITFVGVVVILSSAAMAMLVGLNKVNCDSFKQASGLDVRSTLWNCYIKTEKGLIKIDGNNYYIGSFKTAEEAYEAYCEKAKSLHNQFFRG